jgi:long-chain acyl-CoA synthetase
LTQASGLSSAGASKERPWFRFWPKGVPVHLEYPKSTLVQMLDEMASQRPDSVQFVFYGRKVTYSETARASMMIAKAIQSLGVKKGERIAIAMPNCPQFAIAYFGALRAGAVVVPVNPLYTDREMNAVLADSGARMVFTLDMFYFTVKRGALDTEVKWIVASRISDYMPKAISVLGKLLRKVPTGEVSRDEGTLWLKDLLKNDGLYEPVSVDPDADPAIFMYTGGTTGVPKAAILTNRNLMANSLMIKHWARMTDDDVVLNVLPWFHVYGLSVGLNSTVVTGSTAVVLPKFSTDDVLHAIKKHRPTYFPGVFSMYIALLSSPHISDYKEDMRSIKYCISGAAPLPVEVAKKWTEVTGGMIVEGYGLSEASPVTHVNPMDDPSHVKYGSIGIPIPDTDARIVDIETGSKELSANEVGELVVSGPQVSRGYWNRPEETRNTFKDGWLYTGDIAYMDDDGYFFIVDRKKDMINVGGLKVWPREIEEVAYQNPAVKMAAAVGIKDEFYGEVPKLYVVLKDEFKGKVTPEEVQGFFVGKLTKYKVPKAVEFREELPTTLVGKIVRRKLRE